MIYLLKLRQTILCALCFVVLDGCSQSMAQLSSEQSVIPRTDSMVAISSSRRSPFIKRRLPIEADAVQALPVAGEPNEFSLPDGEMFAGPPAPSTESDALDEGEDPVAKGRPSPDASKCPIKLDTPDFVDNATPISLPTSGDEARDDASEDLSRSLGTVTNCYHSGTWTGDAPPSCDNNGAFRRDFTPPGYTAAGVIIQVPVSNPKLSPGPCPTHGDTGYIYLESWPGSQQSNSEGGLMYSKLHNAYNLYLRNPHGIFDIDEHYPFPAGSIIDLELSGSDTRSNGNLVVGAVLEATDTPANCGNDPPKGIKCGFSLSANDIKYVADCCIFGRMTTIAQDMTLGNVFNDGSAFGPVQWEDAALLKFYFPSFSYSVQSDWTGSSQDWPNDPTRIEVSGYSPTGEVDTINLHR